MSTTIESLEIQIQSDASSAVSGLDALANSLGKLKSATQGGMGLATVANQIVKLGDAIRTLNGGSLSVLSGVATSLKSIALVGNADIGKVATQLKKIPSAMEEMSKVDIQSFSKKMKELSDSLKPLENVNLTRTIDQVKELSEVTRGVKYNTGNSSDIKRDHRSASSKLINLVALMGSLKTIGVTIGRLITSSTKYTEDLNLFTVALGRYASEANRYADQVSEVMGIDPAQWLRNQGIFMTITEGFGVVSDRAYIMSRNLTQLGYDISSFYNLPVEEAFKKLTSGISGELEPLRRLGYDLSIARLQQEALNLGINQSVNSMTQAEKAELRYYAIMTQVTEAQGDMARTLTAPANQLRILGAQVVQCARSLGNIFIPMLTAILPYLIAFAKAVRLALNSLATIFGFKLPEINYSGVNRGLGGISDKAGDAASGLGKASKKAKELKNALIGIDELNVISPPEPTSGGSPGGGGSGGGGLGGLGFELPQYDFIGDAVTTKIESILEKMKETLHYVLAVGAGLLSWVAYSKIMKKINEGILYDFIKKWPQIRKGLGIGLMVTGGMLSFDAGFSMGYEGVNVQNVIKAVVASLLSVGGSLLFFGATPTGWAVGIGLTLLLTIVGVTLGARKAQIEKDLAKRFGDLKLTDEQSSAWAKKLTSTKIGLKLDLYAKEVSNLESIKTDLDEAISNLNEQAIRIECGLDVSQEDYRNSIDKYLSAAQAYVDQNQLTSSIVIETGFSDEATKERLSAFANEYYSNSRGKLNELGDKLKGVISEGFVNGEWIPNKLEEAKKLQEEIQKVLEYQSSLEYRAKMEALKLDISAEALDAESFKATMQKAQGMVEESLAEADKIRMGAIEIAFAEYDMHIENGEVESKAAEIRDKAIADAEATFRETKAKITTEVSDFALEGLKSAYSNELKEILPYLDQPTDKLFKELKKNYKNGMAGINMSGVARDNLTSILKELEPTASQLETIAKSYTDLGESIPSNVADGLRDINLLKAMSGDLDAMNALIESGLNADVLPESATNMGKEIVDGVASGLKNQDALKSGVSALGVNTQKWLTSSGYGGANSYTYSKYGNNIVAGFNSGIGKHTGVKNTMVELGSKVRSSYTNKLDDNGGFNKIGRQSVSGYNAGVANLVKDSITTVANWGDRLVKTIRNKLDIHSPSRVFEEMGEFTVLGFNKGVENLGYSSKGVVDTWVKSIVSDPAVMSLAVDTSALKYYNSDSFSREMSANISSSKTLSMVGFQEGMEEFYREYVEPTLNQIANDMRRQADKEEQTIVTIGNRAINDAVVSHQKANGYSFAK